MKQDHINYFVVGLFTLAMLALLMVVLFRITGRADNVDFYYAKYSNIRGIQLGTAVTYGGYQIGQVDAILPERVGAVTSFKLKLAIKEGWGIPEDSTARIISPGFLSGNQIDILEGKSATMLAPESTLAGQEEVSLMAALNTVTYEVQDLSDNSIKPFIDSLRKHVDAIGGTLGEKLPETVNRLNAVLDNLDKSADQLQVLLGSTNQRYIKRTLRNAAAVSSNLLEVSKGLAQSRTQLNQLLGNANELVAKNRRDVRSIVTDLRTTATAMAENIESIVYNLEATSRNMNEFSRQVRENPGLLLGGKPQQERTGNRR